MSCKTLVSSMNQRFSTLNVHFVLNGDIYNNNSNNNNRTTCHMNIVRMILCSYCIQMYRSDITASGVRSDNIYQQHIFCLQMLHLIFCAACDALCSVNKAVRSSDSGGWVTLETDLRALIMNASLSLYLCDH